MKVKHVRIVALALIAGAGAPGGAAGQEPGPDPAGEWATPWKTGAHDRVRLVAASRATGSKPRLRFGLEFRLDPSWKIFWRQPGDAGLPPRVDWSGSTNVASVTVRWPRPVRFSEYGITSWGYRRHVILPLIVTPRRPGRPVVLRGDLRYQVCREICILGEARLSLRVPAGPMAASPAAAPVARFLARVPAPFARSSLSALDVRAVRHGDKTSVVVTAEARASLPPGLRAIVEGPPGFRVATVATGRVEFPRSIRLRFAARVRPAGRKLDGLPVTVTLLGKGIAVERHTRLERAR